MKLEIELSKAEEITIGGQRFSMGFFQMFAIPDPTKWFRVYMGEHGAVVVQERVKRQDIPPEIIHQFELLCDRWFSTHLPPATRQEMIAAMRKLVFAGRDME